MKKIADHIVIQISGLKDGDYSFHFDADSRDLDLPENFTHPISIDIDLEKLKQRYILHVIAKTNADFQCDRCLEQVLLPLTTQFPLLCTSDANEVKQIDEDEEVIFLGSNDHIIDLTHDVRDYLLLAVPLRKICGEDQEGNSLCKKELSFSVNEKRIEPVARWSALQKINFASREKEK